MQHEVIKQGVDYIGLGVGGIIQNEKGLVFAALRGRAVRNEPGTWEFPGGGVEFGEEVTAALQREVFEEYGIKVSVGELLGYIDFLLPDQKQHLVGLHFVCNYIAGLGEIKEPDKCEKLGWFSFEELESLHLSTPTQALLKNLKLKYP